MKKLFYLLLLPILTLLPLQAMAKPSFPPIVRMAYQVKSNGKIDAELNNCLLCHLGGPPTLNPYGKLVRGALQTAGASKITPAILHSLDNIKLDSAGFTVADAFAEDVPPGDGHFPPPPAHPAQTASNASAGAAAATQNGGIAAAILKLLFPKHAQHPVLVHFPIALFIFGLFLDLFGVYGKHDNLIQAGYYCLLGAAVTAVPSYITGLLAYHYAFGGKTIIPLSGMALYHFLFATTTTIFMIALAVRRRKNADVTSGYIAAALLTALLLAVTGHLGGNLSGVN